MLEQIEQLSTTERMARDSGLVMEPEVEELSSMTGLPFDPALFNTPG
jgi:hypothetical protein